MPSKHYYNVSLQIFNSFTAGLSSYCSGWLEEDQCPEASPLLQHIPQSN